jgi:hypothetical protein
MIHERFKELLTLEISLNLLFKFEIKLLFSVYISEGLYYYVPITMHFYL